MQNSKNLMECINRFGSIMNILLTLKLLAEMISTNKILGNLFGLADNIDQQTTKINEGKSMEENQANCLKNVEEMNVNEDTKKEIINIEDSKESTTNQSFNQNKTNNLELINEQQNDLKSEIQNPTLNAELLLRLLAAQQEQQKQMHLNAQTSVILSPNELNNNYSTTLNPYFLRNNDIWSFNSIVMPSTSSQQSPPTVEQLHEREQAKVCF